MAPLLTPYCVYSRKLTCRIMHFLHSAAANQSLWANLSLWAFQVLWKGEKEASGKVLKLCRFMQEQEVICDEVNNIRMIIWPIKGFGSGWHLHAWQNKFSLRRKLALRLCINSSLLFTSPRGIFKWYHRNSYRNWYKCIHWWMMGQVVLTQISGSFRCLCVIHVSLADLDFLVWNIFWFNIVGLM